VLELIRNPRFDFIGKRYVGYVISTILVGLGVWALVRLVSGEARIGIDLIGGTLVSVKFERPVHIEQIRGALRQAHLSDRDVQRVPGEEKFLIRLGRGEVEVGQAKEVMTQVLTTALPGVPFLVDRHEEVGPAVGAKMREQGLKAIMISTLAILLYIWMRFDLVFGVGATVATVHDVLAVLGIYVLMDKEFTLLIVTALLTIAGYSLTDTVVVYDRIRDNLKLRTKDESYSACVNRSVNEVLTRTIVTSLTTLLAALSLFLLGGEVIHDFALALVVGLVVGTYSSIFVATPLVVEWEHRGVRSPLTR